MFIGIGKKLKTLAKAVAIIGIVLSIAGGLLLGFSVGAGNALLGVAAFAAVAVVGSLISWVASWTAYAIGENNEMLHRLTDEKGGRPPKTAPITRTAPTADAAPPTASEIPSEEAKVNTYGDAVTFGLYNNSPIVWRKLDERDGTTLLVTERNLVKRAYHNKDTAVSWENSGLREWLNDAFYGTAFSESDQGIIVSDETLGSVFLLSIEEARGYFADDRSRTTRDPYWLRSQGLEADYAAVVADNGAISEGGYVVSHKCGVRPAIWVRL
ncbi:MAG: DUF6273 domain-containing protein [Oscillospiraceae bacterium]|jgi:hypothetical protein|nr:DUF6273 domain-containing protein [Oscillospiraceae bacterium]